MRYPFPVAQNIADVKRDTLVFRSLLDSARSKAARAESDSAQHYFVAAGQLARQLDFKKGYYEYSGEYARFLYRQLRFKDALRVSEEQLARATSEQNNAMMANAYNNIGVQYHALGDLHRSAENYIQAIKASENLRDHKNQQKYNSNLASIFLDLKDKEKCLYYARMGYAMAVQMNDTVRIGNSLVNLSCSEILNEHYDDAKAHLQLLMAIGYKQDNIPLVMDGCINLGEIALREKAYETALAWNRKALGLMDDTSPPDYAIYIHDGLAKSYRALGQYSKAEVYFEKSLQEAESENFTKNELKDLYLFGAEVKEILNKPYEALALRKKYDVLKDSILNETTQSGVHELEARYQSTLKEKALTQQQLVIANHKNELQEKNKWIILSTSGVILLSLAGAIIFLYYRHKRRIADAEAKGLLLQAQINGEELERARQARELHDGVAGILSAARMHLCILAKGKVDDTSKGVYEKALSLITHAGNEVRNISHNLAPEILLRDGLENSIHDFCNRIDHPDLQVQYYSVGEIPPLMPGLKLLVYRIVQEAINNVIKHARASRAIVQTTFVDQQFSLSIEDNGVGFDASQAKSKGLGIRNLVSRIQSVGGSYEISSSPDRGTIIHLVCDVSGYIEPAEATSSSDPFQPFGLDDARIGVA